MKKEKENFESMNRLINILIIIATIIVIALTIAFVSLRSNNIINFFSEYMTVLLSLFFTHIISVFLIIFIKKNNDYNKKVLYFNYALYCVCLCFALLTILGFLFVTTTIDFIKGV